LSSDSPHISHEIPDQLFRRREYVRFFSISVVPVIALTRLIVIQNEAFARPAVEQAVLEGVPRPFYRSRNKPEAEFGDRPIVVVALTMEYAPRPLHMT